MIAGAGARTRAVLAGSRSVPRRPGLGAYGAAVLLLVAVLAMGLSANGATRWIGIGDFSFQPSELAKLGLLLVLAAVLGSQRPSWQRFVAGIGLAVVPITFTACNRTSAPRPCSPSSPGPMLVIGRIPARIILPLFAGVIVVGAPGGRSLRPYQLQRLGSFLVGSHESPDRRRLGGPAGAHRGRLGLAVRPTDDPLSGLRAQYLPEKETDLALASLVEQYGLVAGAVVISRRSSWCGGSRSPAACRGARTARWSRVAWRYSSASRSSCRSGATSACSRWPVCRSRCSASAARRCWCTSPRSASPSASGGREHVDGCGPCRAGGTAGRGSCG